MTEVLLKTGWRAPFAAGSDRSGVSHLWPTARHGDLTPTDHREVVRGRRDEKHLCREEQGSGAELRPSGDYGGYFTESQFLTEENKLTGFNVSGRQLSCGSEVNPDEFSLREVKGDVLWSLQSRQKGRFAAESLNSRGTTSSKSDGTDVPEEERPKFLKRILALRQANAAIAASETEKV